MAGTAKFIPALSAFTRRVLQWPLQHGTNRSHWSRSDLSSELSSTIEKVESRIRKMDQEMARIFDELHRVPHIRFTHPIFPFSRSRKRSIPIFKSGKDDGKHHVVVNLDGLEPKDISIKLEGRLLTIRGEKEDKNENVDLVHEYCCKYELPAEVDPDMVQCFFNQGVLEIEAPLSGNEQTERKEMPVQKENSYGGND